MDHKVVILRAQYMVDIRIKRSNNGVKNGSKRGSSWDYGDIWPGYYPPLLKHVEPLFENIRSFFEPGSGNSKLRIPDFRFTFFQKWWVFQTLGWLKSGSILEHGVLGQNGHIIDKTTQRWFYWKPPFQNVKYFDSLFENFWLTFLKFWFRNFQKVSQKKSLFLATKNRSPFLTHFWAVLVVLVGSGLLHCHMGRLCGRFGGFGWYGI